MAGGEFCVNATRCAIYQYLQGNEGKIKITLSGTKEKLLGGINKEKNVYVTMKINKKINQILNKRDCYNLIKLDGILLIVLSERDSEKYIRGLKQNEKEIMQPSADFLNIRMNVVKESTIEGKVIEE